MEAILEFITHLGWLAVVVTIFAESGLLIGFFLPGDSLLFTAGFLVQQDILPINIHLFVFLLFIAAVLGDSVGYAFGQKVGRKLFERENTRFFRKENLERAEAFYEKHGAKTVVIARFVPIVRTFAPIVAGSSKMPYRTFLAFNIIGGALWTVSFTYLGYFAGKFLIERHVNVEAAALIIIAISVAPIVIHLVSEKDRRLKLIDGTKREIAILLGKQKR
ncbi:MAG TPA: VTT domain-containing protein [Candidatus Saccharimonadales bacterium]